ncbi:hypothetical protein T06_14280, partial [Trichinella sp. T6]
LIMAETQHVLATRMGLLRLGHIEEFDTSNPKEWNSYASRLMFYLEANKVSADADKRAVLLSSCGSALFKLVESLLSPAKPVERSFDEIISVLNDHFAPQPSEIVNRHIFYQRKQRPGETVAEFIADLRRLAQGCNFVDLETMLRDRLACGLRDEAVQLRLFAKKVLTFQMAQEEALSAEAACKHACEIRAVNVDSSAPNIHHMSSKRQTYKQANVCASCGGQHNRAFCRFKNAVCRCCQKAGHIERVCRSKQWRCKPQAKANAISVADTHQSYLLNRITCRSTPSLHSLKLSVSLALKLEADSGSDVTIISEQTFEDLRNNKKLKLASTTLSLVPFLGKQVKLMGSCFVNVDYSIIYTRLRIFVAKGNCPNLLGLEWFKPLGIRIESINHINSSPVESAVFTSDLGCYAGEPVSLDLDPSVLPVRMKARKVPLVLKEKIDMELDKLVKQKLVIRYRYSSVGGVRCDMLVDTGSAVTLANERFIRHLKTLRDVPKPSIRLETATGTELEITNACVTEIILGNSVTVQHTVLFVKELSHKILFGWDFMRYHSCTPDPTAGCLRMRQGNIPFLKSHAVALFTADSPQSELMAHHP